MRKKDLEPAIKAKLETLTELVHLAGETETTKSVLASLDCAIDSFYEGSSSLGKCEHCAMIVRTDELDTSGDLDLCDCCVREFQVERDADSWLCTQGQASMRRYY